MKLASTLLPLFLITLLASPANAEGPIRQRIKEKMQERFAEKLQEKPAPSVNASISEKITKPGDYFFSLQHDNLARMYHVHVPPQYNPSQPSPVVFAFHGGGGDMEYMAKDETYGLITKSNKEGFIVIFPNGYSKFQSGKLATWNAGNCCGDARDLKVDDVGFVRKIISNIHAQMNIDSQNIFATGMSNGGMMSQRLACEMPETFKAIASVAGTDNTIQCHPSKPISVLHIHAQNDDHVLFNGGAGENAFKDPSKVTNFTSVPETISRWLKRDNCTAAPERVLSTSGAYCDLYNSCADGTQVKLCVTEKGGHSWPGGNKSRGEPASKAISANDELWNFFKSLK